MKSYVVHVFQCPRPVQRTGPVAKQVAETPLPKELQNFGVDGENKDQAKKAAKTWLEERGRTVRSISWGPGEEPEKPILIAYVYAED